MLAKRAPVFLIVVATALAACQPQRTRAPVADGAAAARNADPTDPPAAGESADGAPVQTARRSESDSAPDASAADDGTAADPPDLARINANPQRLLGADGPGLRARLGEPTRRRAEADARVWQYHAGQCVLDVVLYPDDGAIRAAHIEARDREGTRIPSRACLRHLRKARAASAD